MTQGDGELQDLYREVLLDDFRSSAHKGRIDPCDFRSHGINPVCGDELELTMTVKNGCVDRICYTGHGCVISQASCAMMAESLESVELKRAKELIASFKNMLLSQSPLGSVPAEIEVLKSLEGVRKYPMRVKCATLAWNTLAQGLAGNCKGRSAEFQEIEP